FLKISFFTNGQFFQLLWCLGFTEASIISLAEYRQSGKARHLVIFILLLAITVWLLIGTFYRVCTTTSIVSPELALRIREARIAG
ncbi:MAG: hypothetical protein ABSC17_11565, partial [Thermacetogeniaceae bacterium]